ncbi:MAG: DUF4231 domain-containing protein [archaeon]
MKTQHFDLYLKRFRKQLQRYEHEAKFNKHLFYIFNIPIIILAASVPVLVSLQFNLTAIIFSLIVAIGTGIATLCNFRDMWQRHRLLAETLKREKALFETKTGNYEHVKDPEELFIETIENKMSEHRTLWRELMKKRK